MTQHYQIVIGGHLDHSWAEWFDGLELQHLPTGRTILSGDLPDQAALYRVLTKVNDLGLTLIGLISDRTTTTQLTAHTQKVLTMNQEC